jgi:hypothetical protein
MLNIARFSSLLFEAFNLAPAYAYLLEMAPKREMSGGDWLTTQRIYRDYGRAASFTFPGALISTAASLALNRKKGSIDSLTALATLCEAATVGIWARLNEPVNHEIVGWKPETLPADWSRRRDQWEQAHATSAALHAVAFTALAIATLRDERK